LFLLAFAPLVFFYSTLDRTQKLTRLFLVNYVFLTLYGFLWAISAFGVVWYAIVMYIAFLISIALCLISADIYHKKISIPTFVISLASIWIYILVSTLPQSINNIKSAGYAEYKIGAQTQEESLMSFHPDYITILFSLNIDPEKQKELFIKYRNTFLSIIDSIPESESLSDVVRSIDHIGKLTRTIAQVQNLEI